MKKKKVVDLFPEKIIIQNEGKKYSDMLNDLIEAFENEFPDETDIDDMVGLASTAWNLACISQSLPEEDFKKMLASNPYPKKMSKILKKMIELKNEKFASYDRYIEDYTLEEKNGGLVLTVLTQTLKDHVSKIMNENLDFQPQQIDFEEGFINRYAIIIKPLQPFFDWINKLYPEDPVNEVDEANVYLIDDSIDDIEKWLKKKFDKFFSTELGDWHTDELDWPQKRSYKMFKQWFSVDISTMIFDLEQRPIIKEI